MTKGWALSTGNLPLGGLPRNSVDRITDRTDMTSAVDRGRISALTQQQPVTVWRNEAFITYIVFFCQYMYYMNVF